LSLLEREVERHYTYPEDRFLAGIPDPQGLGSSRMTGKFPCPVP
jgi:hypothetical protein